MHSLIAEQEHKRAVSQADVIAREVVCSADVIMASEAKILAQMLSTTPEMKPLPLQMRSKTASELRLLAEIIGRRRRPSSSSLASSRAMRGLGLWEAITKEWNSVPWVSKRTPLQLRKFWGNHKCRDPVIKVDSRNDNARNKSIKSSKRTSHSAIKEELELEELEEEDTGEGNDNASTEESENDNSHDMKLVPEIEIITEPESVMEVSRNGQLNFYPRYEALGVDSSSPIADAGPGSDTCYSTAAATGGGGAGCGGCGGDGAGAGVGEETVKLHQEEHHLRIAMLRQQQLYRQVEHAAKIEEHEAAMKVYELQKEYWKRMLNKL